MSVLSLCLIHPQTFPYICLFFPLIHLISSTFTGIINTSWLELWGFPCSAVGKKICLQCRSLGSIPWLGISPAEGNGNPLLYSCLENPLDRGAWWTTVHRATKSRTWLKRLSTHITLFMVQLPHENTARNLQSATKKTLTTAWPD